MPILNEGLLYAKTYPKRSYILAVPIDPAKAPDGMFIGAGKEYQSIRTTPYKDGVLLYVLLSMMVIFFFALSMWSLFVAEI